MSEEFILKQVTHKPPFVRLFFPFFVSIICFYPISFILGYEGYVTVPISLYSCACLNWTRGQKNTMKRFTFRALFDGNLIDDKKGHIIENLHSFSFRALPQSLSSRYIRFGAKPDQTRPRLEWLRVYTIPDKRL